MSYNRQMHPWISIWIHPRATLRKILDYDARWLVLPLAICNGIMTALTWIAFLYRDPTTQAHVIKLPLFILLLVVVGVVLSLVHLYFGSWLYRWTGSWLKGGGSFLRLKCAVGWSCYPVSVALVFNLLQFLFQPYVWLAFFFALCYLVTMVWAFIITLQLIGEAHHFSAWRSLGTLLLALALVVAVAVAMSLTIGLLRPLFE